MTYREKFGKYEILIGGTCYKWFKTMESAEAEFESMAQYPDELEGGMELVDMRTGEVLRCVEEAAEAATEELTIKEAIVSVELSAMEERLEKLIEIGAPSVVIEGQRKAVKDMKNGILKIGGAKEKLGNKISGFEVRTGNGGKKYMVFSDGTMYFPNAKYGRYVK